MRNTIAWLFLLFSLSNNNVQGETFEMNPSLVRDLPTIARSERQRQSSNSNYEESSLSSTTTPNDNDDMSSFSLVIDALFPNNKNEQFVIVDPSSSLSYNDNDIINDNNDNDIPIYELFSLGEEEQHHQQHERRLATAADYTKLGDGFCSGTQDYNYYDTGTSGHDWSYCVNRCSPGLAFSYARTSSQHCTGCCHDWEIWCSPSHETRYRQHCLCHDGQSQYTSYTNHDQYDCFVYNKGDRLAGLGYASTYYFAGQGNCVGTVNGAYFSTDLFTGKWTDYHCAAQCDSASYLGFDRHLSNGNCHCLKATAGNGDVKYVANSGVSCYSRMQNRIGGTSGMTYEGYGEYSIKTQLGTAQTDAECAEKCLDGNIAGLIGITHVKNGGACYCATSGATRSGSKAYSSYSVDTTNTRVLNCPTNSWLLTTLSNGKTTLTSQCKCTDTVGTAKTLSILDSETCHCPSAASWCGESYNDKLYLDCDGDGNLDSFCIFGSGYHMLKSQNQCQTVTKYNSALATKTNVVTDCPAANYGNQNLGAYAGEYFWKGAGPCLGSSNGLQFSHFEIPGLVSTDAACAQHCASTDARKHRVVSFTRDISIQKCYCQFQKDTADFTINYNGAGVGGVQVGTDNRFSCYGHYQSGNQVMDSKSKFLVADGRTRFEWKGMGPCADQSSRQFKYFTLSGSYATDDLCLSGCLAVFADVVGSARHTTSGLCQCMYDAITPLPGSLNGYTPHYRNGAGTGEVFGGWLDEYSCMGRVEGKSGFQFKGIGPCRDSANRQFPHFQIQGQETTHTDAECGDQCLRAFPSGVIGFTRHKRDFQCYCIFESGTALPIPINGYPSIYYGTGVGRFDVQQGWLQEYSCYGLDSTSRVTDCPANSVLKTALDGELKILESWCDCDSLLGKDIYGVGESCNCTRPYQWCTEPGDEYFHLDCDGDSTLDSVCFNGEDGDYKTLLSKNACDKEEVATSAIGTKCPAVDGCPRTGGWCSHAGAVYSSLDCDGDGAKDSFCQDGSYYWVLRSSNGCVQESAEVAQIGGICPAMLSCTRPDNWCSGSGDQYSFIDCDGDGGLDSLCQTSGGGYQLIKSGASGCATSSGSNVATACPAVGGGCPRPDGWCGHLGSQYYYVDCDGDGILDSHCRDETGRTWTRASKQNCIPNTKDKCPAADYCTHRDDWCNNAGSHSYMLDPAANDPDANTLCIANIGKNWTDTNCYRPLAGARADREYILSQN